jgi:hypothetical protein
MLAQASGGAPRLYASVYWLNFVTKMKITNFKNCDIFWNLTAETLKRLVKGEQCRSATNYQLNVWGLSSTGEQDNLYSDCRLRDVDKFSDFQLKPSKRSTRPKHQIKTGKDWTVNYNIRQKKDSLFLFNFIWEIHIAFIQHPLHQMTAIFWMNREKLFASE